MEPQSRRSIRILVVDDDASSAQALAALLREEGHTVGVARSGAAAIAELAAFGWELLLIDPSLRDQSGPRVLSEAEARGVPLIVLTADPAFDPARRPDARARPFLYKPIHLPTLLVLIADTAAPAATA